MKKILFSLFLLAGVAFGNPKVYGDIFEGQKEGLREAKLMLYIISSSKCPHCHNLLNDIGKTPHLLRLLEEDFIFIVTDLEDPRARIPNDLAFNGKTPTTYILTPTGNLIGTPIEGGIKAQDLYTLLKGLEDYKKERLGF